MTSTPLANDGSVTVSAPSHWTSDTISVISQDVLLRDTQRPPSSRRSWWSKIWGKDGAKKKYRPLLLDTAATVRHDLDEQGMFNEGAAATGGTTVAKFSRDEIETGSSLPSTHHLDTKHGTKPPSFQIFEVKGFFNAEQYLVNPNDTAGFTDSMLDFRNSNSNNQNSVFDYSRGDNLDRQPASFTTTTTTAAAKQPSAHVSKNTTTARATRGQASCCSTCHQHEIK